MSDPQEILVDGELNAFREAYVPTVRPPGTGEVRRTVRRRRRTAVVAAAVAVLAVAIPVGANAALDGRPTPPGPAQTGDPTPSAPTPPPTPSASATPSATPATPAAPDGRITRARLLAARVDLPAWQTGVPGTCTTRDVRLREPQREYLPEVRGDLRYGDLDDDGATETVALVACRYGEASAKQVVAFDRDRDGRIVTLGRVIGTREDMDDITAFSVEAGGVVRVQVADIQPCCGTPAWSPQRQWRTYKWTGERFDQTSGPTRFGADPRLTDLTLSAGDLRLSPTDESGQRIAFVTVTVVNKGPVDVPRLGFARFDTIGEPTGGTLTRCRAVDGDGSGACLLDPLAAGGRKTYTFEFRYGPEVRTIRPQLQVIHFDAQDRYWADRKRQDNTVELNVVS
ncbi:hypothetical protein ACIBTV_02215 [Micromonospora sp. NPDC049366]|uniref:hypothetical protein n=1 Tax=Micromonospora sp. NPDC049366 TaxID=3364271 RepID=UPI0037B42766